MQGESFESALGASYRLLEVIGQGATGQVWRAVDRRTEETLDGMVSELSYDAAGQLVSSGEFDGRVVAYSYDGSGRRTSASATDGTTREFIWSKRGWLSGVVDKDSSGETALATTVVDALGELCRLNDAEVFFDTSDDYAPAVVQFGDDAVIATGAFTGIGQSWDAPGWRGVRSDPRDATDPWGDAATGISPSGAVGFAGLEWLGARVFDPAARGFLSVDPLDTIVGSGWSGTLMPMPETTRCTPPTRLGSGPRPTRI